MTPAEIEELKSARIVAQHLLANDENFVVQTDVEELRLLEPLCKFPDLEL